MRRCGFTLLEVLTASVITVVIVGALASVLAVTAKAMPAPDTSSTTTRAASIALQAAAADLSLCKGLKGYDATSIRFTLVDRDSDGSEETLNIAWGGSPGDPLEIDTNGVVRNIIDKVDTFAVGVETFADTATSVSGTVTGPEVLLAGYEGPAYTFATLTTSGHAAQAFRALLPADAISYSITKFELSAHRPLLTPGTLVVELKRALADGSPTGTAYETFTRAGGLLALGNILPPAIGTRYTFTLASPITGCVASDRFAIAASTSSGTMYLAYADPAASDSRGVFSLSTNGGSTWAGRPGAGAGFLVYGRVTRPATVVTSVTRADSVLLRVRPTGGQEITLNVPLLGKPLTP